jgi:hypothetical protein
MEESNTIYRRVLKKYLVTGDFVSVVGKIKSSSSGSCVLDIGKGGRRGRVTIIKIDFTYFI